MSVNYSCFYWDSLLPAFSSLFGLIGVGKIAHPVLKLNSMGEKILSMVIKKKFFRVHRQYSEGGYVMGVMRMSARGNTSFQIGDLTPMDQLLCTMV